MKILITVILGVAIQNLFAQENFLAVSQGISSPSSTSTVNYSNGFTHENPLGVIYQKGARLTGQYHEDDESGNSNSGYGAELGYGNGTMGAAIGYYENDCDNCDGDLAAAAGAVLGSLGLGVRVEEEIVTLGLLINPKGMHRFGVTADIDDSAPGDNNEVRSYGAGYAYNKNNFTFAIDASKRETDSNSPNDDIIMVTPGVLVQTNMLGISVSYDTYLNEPDGVENDNDLWVGIGLGSGSPYHLGFYLDYIGEWALVGSYYF